MDTALCRYVYEELGKAIPLWMDAVQSLKYVEQAYVCLTTSQHWQA